MDENLQNNKEKLIWQKLSTNLYVTCKESSIEIAYFIRSHHKIKEILTKAKHLLNFYKKVYVFRSEFKQILNQKKCM